MTSSAPTGRVELRDVEEADLPIFFADQADPEASKMAAFKARDRDEFNAHWARILADDRLIKKTILVDGQVAGNLGSFGPPEERLVGYWIGRRYWGQGVATRALTRFLEEIKERPLGLELAVHNLASIRVLEKCGFRRVGAEHGSPDARLEPVEELIFEKGVYFD